VDKVGFDLFFVYFLKILLANSKFAAEFLGEQIFALFVLF